MVQRDVLDQSISLKLPHPTTLFHKNRPSIYLQAKKWFHLRNKELHLREINVLFLN